VANIENSFIESNLDFTAASGWLQRLVRPIGYSISGSLFDTICQVEPCFSTLNVCVLNVVPVPTSATRTPCSRNTLIEPTGSSVAYDTKRTTSSKSLRGSGVRGLSQACARFQRYLSSAHVARTIRVPMRANVFTNALRSNEKEISHGRVSWQTRWTYFEMGPLASSIG
jgi:hypothetical protein